MAVKSMSNRRRRYRLNFEDKLQSNPYNTLETDAGFLA